MSVGGTIPAGSSRAQRLDPSRLPVCFTAADSAADGQVREIEIHPGRIVMRRTVRGMRMALNMPTSAFRGVMLHMIAPSDDDPGAIAITLVHEDATLSVPLFAAPDGEDAIADWKGWAQALMLPLLVIDMDGIVREPFPRLGAVRVAKPARRRRRQTALRARRPVLSLRRRTVRPQATPALHRGEREIIARN